MTTAAAAHGSSFVLGIDFGGTKVALATATADGTILERRRVDTDAARGAGHVLDRAMDSARGLIAETGMRTGGRAIAACAATFGIVHGGRIALAPNVPGWEGIELPRLLRDGLADSLSGGPVSVVHDVKAATLAELRWGALAGADTAIYVNLGTGVSAGLVVGGAVVDGAHGAAGEIGYQLGAPDDSGYRAGRAPLEERVSGSALRRRGGELFGEPITADELLARADEPGARELLDDALGRLAVGLTNLCVALDPTRVVIGGGLMRSAAPILSRLRPVVARAVPFPPEVLPARFADDATLLGALAHAAEPQGRAVAP